MSLFVTAMLVATLHAQTSVCRTVDAPATGRLYGRPVPPIVMVASPDSGVDTTRVPLTDDVLSRYIAVKKDLATFWGSHADLLAIAQSTAQDHEIDVPGVGDSWSECLTIPRWPRRSRR